MKKEEKIHEEIKKFFNSRGITAVWTVYVFDHQMISSGWTKEASTPWAKMFGFLSIFKQAKQIFQQIFFDFGLTKDDVDELYTIDARPEIV